MKLLHWHTKFYKIWTNVSKVEMDTFARARARGRAHTHTHIQACACTYIQLFSVPLTNLNTLAHRAWWSHKHVFSLSKKAIFLLSTAAPIKHDIFVPECVTFNMACRTNYTELDSGIYVQRTEFLSSLLNMRSHFRTDTHCLSIKLT